jgi:uncharacterized protein
MKHFVVNRGFVLVLNRGEELIDRLTNFCSSNNISSGWVNGLGAVSWLKLGFYNLDVRKYEYSEITQNLEITSLSGNISTNGGEKAIHLHGSFSDDDMRSYGGHVAEAIISGTCEIYLSSWVNKFERKYDPDTGLNLLAT